MAPLTPPVNYSIENCMILIPCLEAFLST